MDAHLIDAPPGHHLSYKPLHICGQAPFSQESRVGVVSEMKLVLFVLFSVYKKSKRLFLLSVCSSFQRLKNGGTRVACYHFISQSRGTMGDNDAASGFLALYPAGFKHVTSYAEITMQ